MESDFREQSEFNMAVSYLNRLNSLLYAANEAALNLNPHYWFHILMTLYRELHNSMEKDEPEKGQQKLNEIKPLIDDWIRNERTGKTQVSNELYMRLHNFEIFLRKIMKNSGLLLKTTDDPTNALQ